MKNYLLLVLTMTISTLAAQAPQEMMLYPTGAIPNSKSAENLEKTEVNSDKIQFTTHTSIPTLTLYRAKKPNGSAVVICPGGGYFGTAGDHEGTQVARMLNAAGTTALVLKYRVPEERTCLQKYLAPLQDAQQALRTARKNAKIWGFDPHRIGILGFSAGGHLAAMATTQFDFRADSTVTDTTSVRPDFAALIYPVVSAEPGMIGDWLWNQLLGENASKERRAWASCERNVTARTPPVFLIHAQNDDVVPVQHSLVFYQACLQNAVPTEMHLYAKGGHGFGLHNPSTKDPWGERLVNWMKTLGQ